MTEGTGMVTSTGMVAGTGMVTGPGIVTDGTGMVTGTGMVRNGTGMVTGGAEVGAAASEGGLGRAFRPQRWVVEVPHTREMSKEAAILALQEAEDFGPFVELALVTVLTHIPTKPLKGSRLSPFEAEKHRVEQAVLRPFQILATAKDVKAFTHVEVAETCHQGLGDAVIKLSAARLYMNTRKHFSLLHRTASAVSSLESNLPSGVTVVVVKGAKKALEILTTRTCGMAPLEDPTLHPRCQPAHPAFPFGVPQALQTPVAAAICPIQRALSVERTRAHQRQGKSSAQRGPLSELHTEGVSLGLLDQRLGPPGNEDEAQAGPSREVERWRGQGAALASAGAGAVPMATHATPAAAGAAAGARGAGGGGLPPGPGAFGGNMGAGLHGARVGRGGGARASSDSSEASSEFLRQASGRSEGGGSADNFFDGGSTHHSSLDGEPGVYPLVAHHPLFPVPAPTPPNAAPPLGPNTAPGPLPTVAAAVHPGHPRAPPVRSTSQLPAEVPALGTARAQPLFPPSSSLYAASERSGTGGLGSVGSPAWVHQGAAAGVPGPPGVPSGAPAGGGTPEAGLHANGNELSIAYYRSAQGPEIAWGGASPAPAAAVDPGYTIAYYDTPAAPRSLSRGSSLRHAEGGPSVPLAAQAGRRIARTLSSVQLQARRKGGGGGGGVEGKGGGGSGGVVGHSGELNGGLPSAGGDLFRGISKSSRRAKDWPWDSSTHNSAASADSNSNGDCTGNGARRSNAGGASEGGGGASSSSSSITLVGGAPAGSPCAPREAVAHSSPRHSFLPKALQGRCSPIRRRATLSTFSLTEDFPAGPEPCTVAALGAATVPASVTSPPKATGQPPVTSHTAVTGPLPLTNSTEVTGPPTAVSTQQGTVDLHQGPEGTQPRAEGAQQGAAAGLGEELRGPPEGFQTLTSAASLDQWYHDKQQEQQQQQQHCKQRQYQQEEHQQPLAEALGSDSAEGGSLASDLCEADAGSGLMGPGTSLHADASEGEASKALNAGHTGGPAPDVDSLFLCPISKERMTDPVVAADGCTYERRRIEQWLETSDVSPSTGDRLAHKLLAPNTLLLLLMERLPS